MFRSFLVFFDFIKNLEVLTIINHLYDYIQHLPESGNINNCQTSATFTTFIQLESGFLSENIFCLSGNEHEIAKLNMFLYPTKR